MSTRNVYATLAEFKAYITNPSVSLASNTNDDTVIEQLIEAACRFIDNRTGRTFYPRIETRYFTPPDKSNSYDPSILMLDDDLLALTTLTNGDTTVITSTYYDLMPKNSTPYWGVRLKDSSSYAWEGDDDGDDYGAISALGWWGYRERYSAEGWSTGSTLNEGSGLNATDTTYTVTSGTLFSAGQIIKIDSEINIISSVSTNDLTVIKRGDNGSTAATHSNGATVYIWEPQEEIRHAVFEIVQAARQRRFGQSGTGVAQVTAAGVVIQPQDITEFAQRIIEHYRRRFWP